MATPNTKILTIPLENTPGRLAEATRAIAEQNVNILAIESTTFGELGLVRLVTDQPEKAERALKTKGYPVTTAEFIEADVPNRPGEIARLCETLAKANVNIEGLWAGPINGQNGRVLVRVDDVAAARRVIPQATTPAITR